MRRAVIGLIVLASFASGSVAGAQQPTKIQVRVSHDGERDAVGKKLVLALKEAIRSSASYELDDEASWRIGVVSLDIDDDSPGRYSAAAVVYAFSNPMAACRTESGTILDLDMGYEVLVNTVAITVGSNVASVAATLFADFDAAVSKFVARADEAWGERPMATCGS